ncbi:MAG: hypothetical protein JSS89_13845 [Bacteroidetes bacterium]|nr:hypothetical protein [Bacteroidota bacterium]
MKCMLLVLAFCASVPCVLKAADSTVVAPPVVQKTAIEISVAGGPQRTFFREPTTPLTDERQFSGMSVMGKLMWHPDHILSVGLLSGYTTFSTESFTKDDIPVLNEPFTLTLEAVPLQLALSMQSGGFEVGVGLGGYLLSSTITGGDAVRQANTIFEIGISTQVSYLFFIGETFSVGPEVNIHLLSNRGIVAISPCLRAKWEFVRY